MVSLESLSEDLRRLGLKARDRLFVHSSPSEARGAEMNGTVVVAGGGPAGAVAAIAAARGGARTILVERGARPLSRAGGGRLPTAWGWRPRRLARLPSNLGGDNCQLENEACPTFRCF